MTIEKQPSIGLNHGEYGGVMKREWAALLGGLGPELASRIFGVAFGIGSELEAALKA